MNLSPAIADRVARLKGIIRDLKAPKSSKEAALRQLRQLEQDTGLNLASAYNGGGQ